MIYLIYIIYKIFNILLYKKEIFDRKNIDLFEVSKICAMMPYPGHEMIFDNNVYGIGNILKTYSDYVGQIDAYIEHGVYFGNHFDRNQWYASKIITFSEQRKNHLSDQNENKQVHVIGPYIHYANLLYSNAKRISIKKDLKKTLLVFPVHSTNTINSKFDLKSFINEIVQKKKKYSFDTLLICLFWKDALNFELVNNYKNNGCTICSAGRKWDKDFLNRLKTIISLSDLTISNDVGTHIGYCVYLNKPHTILNYPIEHEPVNKIGIIQIKQEQSSERLVEINDVKSVFIKGDGSLFTEITTEQMEMVNKYWGINYVKTEKEIYNILRKSKFV